MVSNVRHSYYRSMQNTSLLRSRLALFGLGFLTASKSFFTDSQPACADASAATPAAPAAGIPETFTGEQAEWILALHRLHSHDRARALQILADYAPLRCSEAQAACIEELLALDALDLRATLVDAMEDCELRHRLRAQSERLAFA